jgi:hypothetical protein
MKMNECEVSLENSPILVDLFSFALKITIPCPLKSPIQHQSIQILGCLSDPRTQPKQTNKQTFVRTNSSSNAERASSSEPWRSLRSRFEFSRPGPEIELDTAETTATLLP